MSLPRSGCSLFHVVKVCALVEQILQFMAALPFPKSRLFTRRNHLKKATVRRRMLPANSLFSENYKLKHYWSMTWWMNRWLKIFPVNRNRKTLSRARAIPATHTLVDSQEIAHGVIAPTASNVREMSKQGHSKDWVELVFVCFLLAEPPYLALDYCKRDNLSKKSPSLLVRCSFVIVRCML